MVPTLWILVSFGLVPLLLGIVLLLLGVFLFARRMKVAGIVGSLLGLTLIASPVLAFLYFVPVFRVTG